MKEVVTNEMKISGIKERSESAKKLYPYQENYIRHIFEEIQQLDDHSQKENIIFQLPRAAAKQSFSLKLLENILNNITAKF